MRSLSAVATMSHRHTTTELLADGAALRPPTNVEAQLSYGQIVAEHLSSQHLVRLLADGDRRRVAAALILGAGTMDEVVEGASLTLRDASAALERLRSGGMVEKSTDGTWTILEAAFALAARSEAPAPAPSEHGDEPDDIARVLDQAFRDGRLVHWPTKRAKRRIVLDHIAQKFEPGEHYTERQINATLASITEDTASIRRWLIDEAFMDRGDGEYWRAGGSVS